MIAPIHAPRWGGLHTVAERVAPLCAERGWPWTVVLPAGSGDNGRDRLVAAGIEVIEIPLRRVRRTRDLGTQLGFVASLPVDIARLARITARRPGAIVQVAGLLHVHGVAAATLVRRPLVWQLHSDQPPALARRVLTPVVTHLADAIMTSGGGLIGAHPGLENAGARTISFTSPVDVDVFRPDPVRRAETRERLGFADGEVVVGTVGGRGPNKNHAMLVRAAARNLERTPNARYLICGPSLEQHREWYEREVVGLADRLGLREPGIVRFHDPGSDVAPVMGALDLFALTSLGEGASIVTAEALASGVPVIANDVGSLGESIEEGVTGHLNRTSTDDELADRLVELVTDADRRTAFGLAARRFAQRRFSLEACVDAHVAAYELAVAGRSTRAWRGYRSS